MLIIKKPTVPLEMQGTINRVNMEHQTDMDMTVQDDISKNSYFILHNVCYQALRAILSGSEAKPGVNCAVVDINKVLGGN